MENHGVDEQIYYTMLGNFEKIHIDQNFKKIIPFYDN